MRIVVTEYPKSGGTWIVGLIGDALGLPKRDIYVGEGYRAFDVARHPWYRDARTLGLTDACVVKSHEPPGSPLASFPAHFLHLLRDGRDVVVSKYFFERDFCVKNGIYERFDEPFDHYVPRVAADWATYVEAWLDSGTPAVRYEPFLEDAAGALRAALAAIDFVADAAAIERAIITNSAQMVRDSLSGAFHHNTFVRKGVAGDWRNHFESSHIISFKQAAGRTLIRAGYERTLDW